MLEVSDLKILKETNEKIIVENNAIIEEKKVQNVELEAENRVFDKLIALEKSKEQPDVQTYPLAEWDERSQEYIIKESEVRE